MFGQLKNKLIATNVITIVLVFFAPQKINALEYEDGNTHEVKVAAEWMLPMIPVAMWSNICFHEVGHLVFSLLLGADVNHIKLYPHTDRGRFVYGGIDFKARTPWTVPVITIAGPLFSMLGGYLAAEALPKVTDPYAYRFLEANAIYGALHYPLYAALYADWPYADSNMFSKWTGIPVLVQMVPTLALTYLLLQHYDQQRRKVPQPNVLRGDTAMATKASAWHLPLPQALFNGLVNRSTVFYNPDTKGFGVGFGFHR